MNTRLPVFVAGSTGRTGIHVVNKLVSHGIPVRGLVRGTKGVDTFGDRIDLVVGDTRELHTFASAIQGCETVICTTGAQTAEGGIPEEVEYRGVENLVQAAKAADIRQFVLVSSIGATQPDHRLNKMFDNILVWKLRGEDVLRASDIPHTIIRPGGLTDERGSDQAFSLDQGDRITGSISREDVAEICVRALDHEDAKGVTFEVVYAETGVRDDAQNIFSDLQKDTS